MNHLWKRSQIHHNKTIQKSNMFAARSNNSMNRRAFRDVTNATREKGDRKATKPSFVRKQNAPAKITQNLGLSGPYASSNANVESRDAPPTTRNPSSYQYIGQVDDIDERDEDDVLCATDYVSDMYEHFRERELVTSVRPVYMEKQPHINERMRSILVDWLVEVHQKFKLVPETLYLAVNLIDRFLERDIVTRPKLQLVGVSCLLIAAKYEEIYPPELRDLVYICDKAYTRGEIVLCEEYILRTIEYRVTIPSAHYFLVRYLKAAHADRKIVQLSCFILDGTLTSYSLLHYRPSQLAAAAVFIARRTVGRNSWSPTLLKYAEYCEEEVIPVARAILAEKASTTGELRGVAKKFSSPRYGAVANTFLPCDF